MSEVLNALTSNCDGKEQYAFEAWAKSQHYDMHEHPLHYLFLDPKTGAAREGWNASIRYCRETAEAVVSAQAAEIERLRTDVLRVVDGAHPYRDESGIIEIPLHTFGLLWRIADEARAALQSSPDGMGEA